MPERALHHISSIGRCNMGPDGRRTGCGGLALIRKQEGVLSQHAGLITIAGGGNWERGDANAGGNASLEASARTGGEFK
ncbi:hypothetical protein EYF80_026156 [Liparis tanakae]|uniref:Uncharacterized protein n=1 Tax=Liparis tanakae TaxID=230148 RepID=A0A4Z2HDL3_9TELE|nr:hypothetical protein EYF80_026156 [Liparis tanakae]